MHLTLRKLLVLCLLILGRPLAGAAVSTSAKVDTFGYRTTDTKIAVYSANPGATVELRNTSDVAVATLAGTSITSQGADVANYSGDTLWWVDFSGYTTPGTYRLYSPSLGTQSYDFEIRDNIYNAVGLTALKTYYYQRCNTAHPAAYAGANWADASACHMGDVSVTAAAGQTNYGTRNLTGGWHDAGDYNKYAWYAVGDSILHMLTAYEDNPGVFSDGDLNIPESGNGVPDILDECKYELDWLLRMQLPVGNNYAVLERVREAGYTGGAPPSTNATTRFYYNPNLESGAMFVGSLAVASRVFAAQGNTAYANTLLTAAKNTWTNWLMGQPAGTQDFNDKRCWAAAELFRADQTVTTAESFVRTYTTWNTFNYDPDWWQWVAALAYIQTPSGTNAATVTQMRARYGAGVTSIFGYNDKYRNGMASWQHYWGSNRPRAKYGLYLLYGAKIGNTGAYTAAAARNHALDFLHYFHGQNAASMTYLTNMSSLGGDHCSWMFYHSWFGASGTLFSRSNFLGKPAAVVEPAYPYFTGTDSLGINDNRTSTYGPAPGFIPGGPNNAYSGNATPPLGIPYYNKAYRDWAWQQTGTPNSWEITENSISSQGPYVALAGYFMQSGLPPTPTRTITPSLTWTPSRTITQTRTSTLTNTPPNTYTSTLTPSPSATSTLTWTPSASPSDSATPSATLTATPTATGTPSSSATPSITLTHTASPPASDTASPTASPAVTDTSTSTPTATRTASPTSTATPSSTQTPLAPDTATSTHTPGPPPPSATFTLTITLTPTPAAGSPTFTASPTSTSTETPAVAPSATSTQAAGSSAPSSGNEAPEILDLAPLPNPNPAALALRLKGQAKGLRLRLYTVGYTALLDREAGPAAAGWSQMALLLPALPSGAYYAEVRAQSLNGAWSPPRLCKVHILR